VAAHIDHIAQLVGVDHIGVGTDVGTNVIPTEVPVRAKAWARLGEEFPELFVPGFDFTKRYAQGLESSSGLPNLTEALMGRGYTGDDVQKIMGGNFLRVFGEVAKARASSIT
jgi:membrane dipeptidase